MRIVILALTWVFAIDLAHASEVSAVIEIVYRHGDRTVVHTIDQKGLKIVFGSNTSFRALTKDDRAWVSEKLERLKKKAVLDCGEDAKVDIKADSTFMVCGRDAQDFLSALFIK
jgi:hypothetical protein